MDGVLIIGGWNSREMFFEPLIDKFKEFNIEVSYVDFNDCFYSEDISNKLDKILEETKEDLHIIAWSMGSLVLLDNYEKLEKRIKTITFFAGTAKFTKDSKQKFGWDSRILNLMIKKLDVDTESVIDNFNEKLLCDNEKERNILINKAEYPNVKALIFGLKYLNDSDFRSRLEKIDKKTMIISGDKDSIISKDHGEFLNEKIEDSKFKVLSDLAHMPFYTDTNKCFKEIKEFWINMN